jgi:hypothetical protein
MLRIEAMPMPLTVEEPSPQPSSGAPGEGATVVTAAGTLTLLREWQSVCDAVAAGRDQLLIRKGGIAEGRAGFELKKSFFGLLPTLFHQVKNGDPSADTPEPPRVVSLICQLVEAFAVPSETDLSSLAELHGYTPEQLAARQTYKTERPLNLLIVRPFRLKAPIDLGAASVKQSCKSWVEVPLAQPMGGIEPVSEMAAIEATITKLRNLIEALPAVTRIPS